MICVTQTSDVTHQIEDIAKELFNVNTLNRNRMLLLTFVPFNKPYF